MKLIKNNSIYLSIIEKNNEQIKYLFSEGFISEDGLITEEFGYNENGILSEKIVTIKETNKETIKFTKIDNNENQLSESLHVYEYNSFGNTINLTIYEDGKLDCENFYSYNNDNLLILEATFDFGGFDYTKEIFYDELKREKRIEFRTNVNIDLIVTIKYDEENKLIFSSEFDSLENLLGTNIIYNDCNNLPTKYERYNAENKLISKVISKYVNEKMTESIDYDENDKITRISKIIYDNAYEIEMSKENYYYNNGELVKKEIFEYNY